MKTINTVFLLTFHYLLEFHLQGLDSTGCVVSSPSLYPVDGQPAIHHSSNIVILQKDHPVCVLDHCTIVTKQTFDFHMTSRLAAEHISKGTLKYERQSISLPCIRGKIVLHSFLIHREQTGVLICPGQGTAAFLFFSS